MYKKIVLILLIILFKLSLCDIPESRKFVIGTHGKAGFFSIFLGALNKLTWAKKK